MCDRDDFYRLSMIKEVSQNLKHLGQDWNISSLEQEGAKNEKNPGRAIGKAAQAYLTWMLGSGIGEAGNAGGAAAEGAAGVGAQAAGQGLLNMGSAGAGEIAKQAASDPTIWSQVMGYMQPAAAETSLNSMESALLDTGYTPSSFGNMMKLGPGSGQGMGRTMMNYGTGAVKGLLGNSNNEFAKKYAIEQGMRMMSPEQPQQPMPQPQPMRQQEQGPLPVPYENSLNSMEMPPPGMSWEEWERLKQQRRMR